MYLGELAEQHVCKMQDNGARGNGTLCRRITQLGGGELRDTTGVGEGTLYVSVEFIYRAGVWGKPNVTDEQRMRECTRCGRRLVNVQGCTRRVNMRETISRMSSHNWYMQGELRVRTWWSHQPTRLASTLAAAGVSGCAIWSLLEASALG